MIAKGTTGPRSSKAERRLRNPVGAGSNPAAASRTQIDSAILAACDGRERRRSVDAAALNLSNAAENFLAWAEQDKRNDATLSIWAEIFRRASVRLTEAAKE